MLSKYYRLPFGFSLYGCYKPHTATIRYDRIVKGKRLHKAVRITRENWKEQYIKLLNFVEDRHGLFQKETGYPLRPITFREAMVEFTSPGSHIRRAKIKREVVNA